MKNVKKNLGSRAEDDCGKSHADPTEVSGIPGDRGRALDLSLREAIIGTTSVEEVLDRALAEVRTIVNRGKEMTG